MPLLNVVNVSTSEVVISDVLKSFPSISVLAGETKNGIKILGKELESAGPVLKRLVDAGKITYTTAQDPDVPDDAENLMGAAAVADGAVTTVKILDANVTTAKLAAAAVTKAKAAVFFSAELTASGVAQSVAHGLGVVPAAVLIVSTQGHNGSGAAGETFTDVVEGTHTTTNVVVTADAGGKFKVMAWA